MIWKTTLAFLVAMFSLGSIYAQISADIPDLRDCSDWNCTSNNFTLDDVYLSLVDGNGNDINITSCTIGDSQSAFVMLNYTSNAKNTINSTRIFADLVIDGNEVIINEFLGDVAPASSGSQTKQIYGPFIWTCGEELRLENILVVWRTGGNNDISQKYDCKDYIKSQCEFGTDTFVASPLAVQFDYSVCREDGTTIVNYTSTTNGGKAPFTYSWDFTGNGIIDSTDPNPVFNTTSSESFTTTLKVTDAAGTFNTRIITINNPGEIEFEVSKTDVSCSEDADGAIVLNVSGGTGVFTYTWTGPEAFSSSFKDISGLKPGSYSVIVKDEFNCQDTLQVEIAKPETPAAPMVAETVQPTCDVVTGSFQVTIVNGIEYSIDGETFSANGTFENLPAGTYNVTAKNADGCESASTQVVINEALESPAAPIVAETVQPTCDVATGSFGITTVDGIEYSFNGGVFGPATSWDQLNPGTYTIVARNDDGCESSALTVTIDAQPETPVAEIANNNGLELSCSVPFTTLTASGGIEYSWSDGSTVVGT
ncbi:MAG TPA: SprB repeat-containing protein, partial [Gillisia sp.]|nr:SprB repeat-containing protein [Gillisia sp.]